MQAATDVYQNSLTPTGLAYTWPQTSPGAGSVTPVYGSAGFGPANQINWKDPYSMQWNLSIDHEFRGNIGTRISYIAMRTDDLVLESQSERYVLFEYHPGHGPSAYRSPLSQLGYGEHARQRCQANYESLQMEANHRFQQGVTFQSTYTWAKNLADDQGPASTGFPFENSSGASYLYNRSLDYGNVYGTRRQRWISTAVYDLPFGHGQRFGANMDRLENGLAGGWRLSNIFLLQTGPYLTAYIPGRRSRPFRHGVRNSVRA